MQPTIAIIAALPREIASLVTGHEPDPTLRRKGICLYRLDAAIVVAAGMGQVRAIRAVEAARAASPAIDTLISAGLAGACAPGIAAGTALEATIVIDTHTGERFRTTTNPTNPAHRIVLATTESIAGIHEKSRLFQTYAAHLVDMEAATVARLANAHALNFRAIKAVSDEHDFELLSLSRFSGKHGHFRTAAFALHTALRPHHWPHAIKLGRASTLALKSLDTALGDVLTNVLATPR